MLAEFASMGGLPILLELPEGIYYYGRRAHESFVPFSLVVRDPANLAAAVREAVARDQRDMSPQQRAGFMASFGEPDGHRCAHLIERVQGLRGTVRVCR